MPKVNAADVRHPARPGRRVATSLSEINVVPMVDVMLVLLIIFMVAAPMIQRGVDVNLPVARNAQQMTGDRVEITVPSLPAESDCLPDANRARQRAAERVRQKMETAAKKDVYLGGDRGVNLGELMEVFSMLKSAGVEHVGIETNVAAGRER